MQRSISLDILKIILCVFVILAHLYPLFDINSKVGWFICNGYSRILVPSFLIINGLFLVNKIEDKKAMRKYFIHLMIVYAVWSAFYAQSYITWESPRNIFVFLITGYHHLWYLPALLVGVVMLFIAKKLKVKDKYLLIIGVGLYIIGNQLNLLGLAEYIPRNGIFYGFTFIALGYLIQKYKIHTYLKTWMLVAILIASLIAVGVEASIYYQGDMEINLFLTSLVLGPVSVLLCLKHPFYINRSLFTEYLGYIPTGVYYVHLFYVYQFYSIDYNIYNLPVIFVLSVLTVIPLVFINKRVKIFL